VKRLTFLVICVLMFSVRADAEELHVCWAEKATNQATGYVETVTRCRVAGKIVNYATEYEVPIRLFAAVGSAGNGTCWYWSSVWTGWEIITRNSDGSAFMGYDSDGVPGGPLNLDVIYPVCTSEPAAANTGASLAWDLIKDYVHQVPGPGLNPPVPWGLTGAETHVSLTPPPPFADSIIAPGGGVLDVNASVAAVTVDWGDGTFLTLAPEVYPLLTGYPDGTARHVYEIKTCDPPGSTPRCHPDLSSYSLVVRFEWFVQWRVGGGVWTTLAVPDTVTTIAYPVKEIISVLDDRDG
jgi:hypothetical protein